MAIPLNRKALLTTRNCLICTHLLVGVDEMFCPIFRERILLPSVAAADCPSYEESLDE